MFQHGAKDLRQTSLDGIHRPSQEYARKRHAVMLWWMPQLLIWSIDRVFVFVLYIFVVAYTTSNVLENRCYASFFLSFRTIDEIDIFFVVLSSNA